MTCSVIQKYKHNQHNNQENGNIYLLYYYYFLMAQFQESG